MNQILTQGVGFLALFFIVLSFQHNNRGRILTYLLIGQFLFTLHFSLLHAWTAAAMNGIGGVQSVIFYFRDLQKWAGTKAWVFFFIVVFLVAGYITWSNIFSILPVIAMVINTFALWNRNTRVIRYMVISQRPFWFTYNIIVGSYAGIVTELLIFFSVLIGILRFDVFKKDLQFTNRAKFLRFLLQK